MTWFVMIAGFGLCAFAIHTMGAEAGTALVVALPVLFGIPMSYAAITNKRETDFEKQHEKQNEKER